MAATTHHQETAVLDLAALLDAGDGAVVTLVAGNTRLAAHRAVLVAGSPVYAAMFSHDTLEASSGEVTILDVEGPVLRQLLAYLYTRRVPQLPDMAPKLLAVADKYGVVALKDACEQQLVDQLALENAAASALLALRHSCHRLLEAAIAFVKDHTYKVMATRGWEEAVRKEPEVVLQLTRLLAEQDDKTRSLPREERGRRLVQAAKEGAAEEVRALLAAGADVGAEDREEPGFTALHWAARRGHLEVVRCLVQAGAELEARTTERQGTPLYYSALTGRTAVVRLLLASSADINARNKEGHTPLMAAAAWGKTEAVAALLEAGADREAKDKGGMTALDWAREKNHEPVIQSLQ